MQQIIIYRSPVEAYLWELLSNGTMFPIIVGIVAFFGSVFIGQTQIVEKYFGGFGKRNNMATQINLIVGALIAYSVSWYMFGKI